MSLFDRILLTGDDLEEGWKDRLAGFAIGAACLAGSPGCSATGQNGPSRPSEVGTARATAPTLHEHPLTKDYHHITGPLSKKAHKNLVGYLQKNAKPSAYTERSIRNQHGEEVLGRYKELRRKNNIRWWHRGFRTAAMNNNLPAGSSSHAPQAAPAHPATDGLPYGEWMPHDMHKAMAQHISQSGAKTKAERAKVAADWHDKNLAHHFDRSPLPAARGLPSERANPFAEDSGSLYDRVFLEGKHREKP